VKRKHFRFGRKLTANIFLRCTRANIFLTLTDIRRKVIIGKSSGSSGILGSKKKKTSPYAIESLIRYLMPYLKLYNIKRLNVVFKSKSPVYYPFLLKNLNLKGFIIAK